MPEIEGAGTGEGEQVVTGAGEGTTPEEVAAVLKGSGININPEDAKVNLDPEEGDELDENGQPKPKVDPVEESEEDKTAREAKEAEEAEAEEQRLAAEAEAEKARKTKELADASLETDDKYAFEVTDANNVTFKIAPGATMEEILAEFEPKNNGQIIDILNRLQKAEAQKATDQQTASEETAKAERDQRVSDIQEGWKSEVSDLTAQKRIPEGADGETRVGEVYKFMAEQNDARTKAGKPTLDSFEDALDKLEARENREAEAQAKKDAKDTARKNGGMVGGSSAPSTSAPKVYKAGSARNVNEAIRASGLLD